MFSKACGGVLKNVFTKSHITECRRYGQKPTHYDVLEVPFNCTTKEVKDAFIKLSKRYHPDKTTRKSSHKHFVRVLEAYNVLSKRDSRRQYDWELTHIIRTPVREQPRYESGGYGYDDPSFWRNRDKSQDYYYTEQPYYGIRGINRVSNGVIAFVCVIISIVGVTLQYFAIRHSVTLKRDALQQRSLDNENVLAKIQADALKNGNKIQIELMEQRFRNNKYYQPPRDKSKDV